MDEKRKMKNKKPPNQRGEGVKKRAFTREASWPSG